MEDGYHSDDCEPVTCGVCGERNPKRYFVVPTKMSATVTVQVDDEEFENQLLELTLRSVICVRCQRDNARILSLDISDVISSVVFHY
jgi:hypothetical protein